MEQTSTYQLLVDGTTAAYIIEEWWHRGYEFEMHIRRPHIKGMAVIELTDPVYAAHLQQYYNAKIIESQSKITEQ